MAAPPDLGASEEQTNDPVRGVWLPLYLPDAESPPAQVGGGAGLAHRAIARVPLQPPGAPGVTPLEIEGSGEPDEGDNHDVDASDSDNVPLTITDETETGALPRR